MSRVARHKTARLPHIGEGRGRDKSRPYIWRAMLSLLLVMLLAGCGETVTPTISPTAAALNFFNFVRIGQVDNAAAYWLPRQITEADVAQLQAAAATLRHYQFRNPAATAALLPATPPPDVDELATAAVTVTAEISGTDGWQPAAPLLHINMVSTSIGWRVRDFSLDDKLK